MMSAVVFIRRRTQLTVFHGLSTQPDAQIVAGATDIGVWINKQNKKISKFISIQDVSELSKVTESDDGFIGARPRQKKLLETF